MQKNLTANGVVIGGDLDPDVVEPLEAVSEIAESA